jgi:hypothetical protein
MDENYFKLLNFKHKQKLEFLFVFHRSNIIEKTKNVYLIFPMIEKVFFLINRPILYGILT